ncbi:MAG: sigma-54-dependent Fis family transcriptional regulator [Bacteroidetes bacterium]|uniref:Sigma-54-dependent Fis family transcriptional regulator n=1 Tax=Candidatus Cryptobacteroides intestinigallinarum TaxID=2840767 RepID=A0A9D9N0S4_9BACT|nr:sigma-54-dependent Fis family transcriptional regulator [Candidatus Cryptobacteroides intestinigallinarum]
MTNQELQSLKNKFDIIGNDPGLNRALEIAVAVAPTDLTVLICGESGVGKENIPKIIHQFSRRRTGKYFAVNCGAIPEGTIDSELFGHEKGSFTGANEMRKGYFEEADGGTLFLDEIGELPMASQAKLLRVLQSGEFIRVGSSKVLKTDVRVIAATNVNLMHAVSRGKFREDLYYRLNAVMITMPALRERQDDIHLLFRKFASDFSEKYGMAKISLAPDAVALLKSYRWPGNIRQLKNVAETVSALESEKLSSRTERLEINASVLSGYIPKDAPNMLPVKSASDDSVSPSEKEAFIRMLYQLRQEVDYLKSVVLGNKRPEPMQLAAHSDRVDVPDQREEADWQDADGGESPHIWSGKVINLGEGAARPVPVDEQEGNSLSLEKAGEDLIRKALEKYKGNRKLAAAELGISERTLYRKLKSLGE